MSFEKLSVKVAIESPSDLDVQTFMATFGEWIQNESVPGSLIDVADYTHMENGPGVVLVSHEANWGLDEQDGYRGLYYSVKVEQEGSLADKLTHVLKTVCIACDLLENTNRHEGLKFNPGSFEIMVNDRMTGVQNDENRETLAHEVKTLLSEKCSVDADVKAESNSKKRLGVQVKIENAPSLKDIVSQLS